MEGVSKAGETAGAPPSITPVPVKEEPRTGDQYAQMAARVAGKSSSLGSPLLHPQPPHCSSLLCSVHDVCQCPCMSHRGPPGLSCLGGFKLRDQRFMLHRDALTARSVWHAGAGDSKADLATAVKRKKPKGQSGPTR